MPTVIVAMTFEHKTLKRLDEFVEQYGEPSRSRAIQEAGLGNHGCIDKTRLIRESPKPGSDSEQGLADGGFTEDLDE